MIIPEMFIKKANGVRYFLCIFLSLGQLLVSARDPHRSDAEDSCRDPEPFRENRKGLFINS